MAEEVLEDLLLLQHQADLVEAVALLELVMREDLLLLKVTTVVALPQELEAEERHKLEEITLEELVVMDTL